MNELEETWARRLSEAQIKAREQGRSDVAEYLALKSSNDAIRRASATWLFDALTEIAGNANRRGANVIIENTEPHQFSVGNATLHGWLLTLRQGVRCLSLEAGWTRAPADGFMRGGALAIARVKHFGLSKHDAELILLAEKNAPSWFSVEKNGERKLFDSKNLTRHFQIFLDTI